MVYCTGSGTMESDILTPELEQGLAIYDFLADNSTADVFFQKHLPVEASLLALDKEGEPSHFILPYPFDEKRQLACMHEWGHYLDDLPRKDFHLRMLLEKPKAVKKNPIIRDAIVNTELRAWHLSIDTIVENEFKFSAETYNFFMAEIALRSYYRLYKNKMEDAMKESFKALFKRIELISPGFLQLPSMQNYFHDVSSK
jgi:hypothetical protein